MIRHISLALCTATLLVIAGCGSTPKEDPNSTQAVEKLYAEGKDELASGNSERAIKLFERVEGRAAGTLLAQQASLDLAYAQYRSNDRASALVTLDRFIRLQPSSPALDYAYYLRGIVNFNDRLGIMSSISRQELSERDQQASREAHQAFRQVVEQFPQSRYAADSKARMDYIINALAEYELHVARYYFRRGAFVAAANRAQQVVTEFPRTPSNEEALYVLVASYEQLGLDQLRSDSLRVLELNFPNSRYLRDGLRQREKSWWQFW
jgi:outer membrane protein assembly factor BamD